MNMASSLFRRFRSEKAKRDELAAVKKELLRLAGIPSESLPMDPACVAALSYGQMLGVSLTVDPAVNIRCVKITMPEQAHELFFTEAGAFRAEQCHALIRRKVSRSSGPVT